MTMSIIDLDVHVVQAYSIVSMYTEKKNVLPHTSLLLLYVNGDKSITTSSGHVWNGQGTVND